MRRLAALLLLLCSLRAVAAAAAGCPQPLRIAFADAPSPPGLMGQGSDFADPPGWQVMAVREALGRLGCTAELLRQPSRRIQAGLVQGQLDFGLLYAATAERQQTLRFPLDARGRPDAAWAPAFGHVALFGPAGSRPAPSFDGRRLQPGTRVGVIPGSVQEGLARERGWTLVPLGHFDNGIHMLLARRFDLLLASREALTPAQLGQLSEWPPAVAQLPFFMPAAPAFADRHPAWTRAFWNAFCHAVRRQEPEVRPADCGRVPAGGR